MLKEGGVLLTPIALYLLNHKDYCSSTAESDEHFKMGFGIGKYEFKVSNV